MLSDYNQLKRAQEKAHVVWNQFKCDEVEALIKRETFSEFIDYDSKEAETQLEVLDELWENAKEADHYGESGFDVVAAEFCKRLNIALKLRSLNII